MWQLIRCNATIVHRIDVFFFVCVCAEEIVKKQNNNNNEEKLIIPTWKWWISERNFFWWSADFIKFAEERCRIRLHSCFFLITFLLFILSVRLYVNFIRTQNHFSFLFVFKIEMVFWSFFRCSLSLNKKMLFELLETYRKHKNKIKFRFFFLHFSKERGFERYLLELDLFLQWNFSHLKQRMVVIFESFCVRHVCLCYAMLCM